MTTPVRAGLALPEALSASPLALDVSAFWRNAKSARAALRFVEHERDRLSDFLLRVDLSVAVEGVEGLRELAASGHPKIRDRAANALPTLLTRLSAFAECVL